MSKRILNTIKLSELSEGEIFEVNGHQYKILEHFIDRTTLIIPMCFMLENVRFDNNSRNYQNSNLKEQIDSKCLPVFEEDFGAENIIEHEVNLVSVDMQNEFGSCWCKARPITFDEARKYNDLLVNKDLPDWYWTLTSWSTAERGWEYSIAVVSSSGSIIRCICSNGYGVRPICILKSNIFVSKREKKLGVGDSFELLGLKWKILDITEKGYKCLAEKLEKKMGFDSNRNDWKNSNLRRYLNEEFYEKLAEKIGVDNIISFERDLLSLDGQTEYGTCEDKVSLLNVDEYRKYRNLIPNTEDYWWWLISPYSTPCNDYESGVAIVSTSGIIGWSICNFNCGVRPFCIFSSSIFESGE